MAINTVTVILTTITDKNLKVLLNKTPDGSWALPESPVEENEDMDIAALKLMEKHAHHLNYFRQLYTLGKADRSCNERIITTAYLSLTPEENLLKETDSSSCWFTLNKTVKQSVDEHRTSSVQLRNSEHDILIEYEVTDKSEGNYIKKDSVLLNDSNSALAGDNIKIVNMAMDELQLHVISSGLIFNLLPKEFTLKQVQNVYEIISQKKKDTANFRRDILKMVTPTGKTVISYNRKAELYRFNPLLQYLKGDL